MNRDMLYSDMLSLYNSNEKDFFGGGEGGDIV